MEDTRKAIFPRGTQPLPGDLVRQVMSAPIVGRISTEEPAVLDQKKMRPLQLVEWEEVDAEGVKHVASTFFEPDDVEILERPEPPAEEA